MGKMSTLVAAAMPRRERFADLIGNEQLTTTLGNKNLQISFPYQEDQVDKVSYHIDEDQQRFNLVVQPKHGIRPLETQTVEFTYAGADADLVFTIGVSSLDSLEMIYFENEELFNTVPIISMNILDPSFGMIKLNVGDYASYSDAMTFVFQNLGVGVPADTATNLLSGIESATDGLRSLSATAETFEAVAVLLRAGARRVHRSERVTQGDVRSPLAAAPRGLGGDLGMAALRPSGNTSSFAAAVAQARRQQQASPEEMPSSEQVTSNHTDRPSRIDGSKTELSVSDRVKAAPRVVPKSLGARTPVGAHTSNGGKKKMFEPLVSEASRGG
jgi:hypothetical protein